MEKWFASSMKDRCKNLTSLLKEIKKHYQFANKANPVDIFKPNHLTINDMVDAEKYFNTSCANYHLLNQDLLYELWGRFEDHFEIEKDCEHNEKGWDQYTDLTEGYECGRGNFEFELRYIYAKKLLELPYDYVFKTFTVIDRKKSIYNPLTDFFSIFEDMFDRKGMSGLSVDWEQINKFYEKHKHYYE